VPIVSAEEVQVGLYLLNLGKFDISTGTFTADFYLSMNCEENCSDFEFMNGRASSVDRIVDTPSEKFYRIQANLNNPVDLRNFPFDSQQLQIVLEDKSRPVEELTYVPVRDESGIDESIFFTGFSINGWGAKVVEHVYPVYDETYSQYVFFIDISRIAFNSFLKTFLPVLVIMLIVMFTFVMDPDKISTRLTVASSSLVATVMFHISIANQIPPVGYLTLADKFMILTYVLLLAAVILNVAMLELLELKKNELVEKIHRKLEYGVFLAVPLIYIAFFFLVI
jgi:hypothetical protein